RRALNQSGAPSLVTGNVVKATAAQAKALGAPYQAGDPVGLGGVEQAHPQQLARPPGPTGPIPGPRQRGDPTPARPPPPPATPAPPGKAGRTSIDMHVQLAASAAVRDATTTKPVDLVAIQPSTGRVLAVIERPGGFNRALQGVFPPGSTFKVVTASALSGT